MYSFVVEKLSKRVENRYLQVFSMGRRLFFSPVCFTYSSHLGRGRLVRRVVPHVSIADCTRVGLFFGNDRSLVKFSFSLLRFLAGHLGACCTEL